MSSETEALVEYRLEQAEETIERLATSHRADVAKLSGELDKMRAEYAARERKALLAGISFLGSGLIAVCTVVWNYRDVIFR